MNEHFVCIKVDREERPDVDQIYMDAVQAMGLQGGWPLNVFLTAGGQAVLRRHLFPARQLAEAARKHWRQAYAGEHRAELEQSAERFAEVLRTSELEKYPRCRQSAEAVDRTSAVCES